MIFLEVKKLENNLAKLIEISEESYSHQLDLLTNNILKEKKRIILLAGPSGSGKTTTAHRIVELLNKKGINSVYLSMDNWYKTKSEYEIPKDENGKKDYESPYCVDIERLNKNLQELLKGTEIELPTFDFVNEKMMFNGDKLQLNSDGIVVLEGLHALNPYIKILKQNSYKVYVCPSDVLIEDKVKIFQEELRLYRRITRDKLHRGRDLNATLELLSSVSRGEKLYLQPYLNDIDYKIDSCLLYELFLHRNILGSFDKLKYLPLSDIGLKDIPEGSIMNEFYKE